MAPGEGPLKFPEWVSAFYTHSIPSTFLSSPSANVELSTKALIDPPSTFSTLTVYEIENVVYAEPALPEGSDGILLEAGHRLGLFEEMRKKALYAVTQGSTDRKLTVNGTPKKETQWWAKVEIRVIWCDQSPFVFPWGIQALYRELVDAKAAGRAREGEVNIVRMKGANHFVSRYLCLNFCVCGHSVDLR